MEELNGHTSVVYKDSLYVYGGLLTKDLLNKSIYEFNFLSKEWKKVKTINDITPRCFHSASIYDNKMYIFGGYDYVNDFIFNDFQFYDFETRKWKQVDLKGYTPGIFLFNHRKKMLSRTSHF
jgi:N-acetylneuraminic acid mutarotase